MALSEVEALPGSERLTKQALSSRVIMSWEEISLEEI